MVPGTLSETGDEVVDSEVSSVEESSDEMMDEEESDDSSNDSGHGTSEEAEDESEREDGPVAALDVDFERFVANIRQTDSGSDASGVLSKMQDFNFEDGEAEFKDDLRAASGIGRVKKKRGRRTGPVLSHQVRALIGDGNQAYVDGNVLECTRIMLEVIRIEPRATSAWAVLAQCHEDLHDSQKALQLRIMSAHLMRDAEMWESLANQSRQLGYNRQALYCYSKLHSLDPTNVNALYDRAFIAKEIGDIRTARHSLLAILKQMPHDLNVLSELRPLLIELSEFSTCASLFQSAFEHYQSAYPSGHAPDPKTGTESHGGGFGLMELLVLADIYNTGAQAEYEKAIQVIKKGCRWLQGRGEQKYWDMCEDDREYDVETLSMPVGSRVVRDGDVQPGMYPLDVNARHRIAVARIKMGDVEEGKMHASIVLSQDVMDYAPLFAEIADAFFEREMYGDARPIYELLAADAGTSGLYVLLQAASCRRMLGDLREAAEVYEHVILADPLHNDAKMQLAEIYEILNEPRRALDLVHQVIDSRRKKHGPNRSEVESTDFNVGASLFEEKSRGKSRVTSGKSRSGLTAQQVRSLEEDKEREVVKGYQRVRELWTRMMIAEETAEREWLLEAEKLVEVFRETRKLFVTTSRNTPFQGMFQKGRVRKQTNESSENSMESRLQLELESERIAAKPKDKPTRVDTFRGVSFDDWLKLFMQYSFLLTKRDQYDLADETLRHILYSNAYQEPPSQDTIRLALITCAISVGRYSIVVEQCRRLIHAHQFNNEPFRILLASLASGLRQTDVFILSTLQKHILRELKICDIAVKNKDILKWNSHSRRHAPMTGASNKPDEVEVYDAVEDEVEDVVRDEIAGSAGSKGVPDVPTLPIKQNPMIIAVYGQICCAAKSYQSSIFYLLHAYDYCPNDPMICLSLAIASLGRAMQRQADNRHHLVVQAMAFLSRYRSLRTESAPSRMDEVDFNFGRAFQQLGLHSHAARHYERVLELAEQRMKINEHEVGFAREAAYNLSMIYVTTGAVSQAQDLYRRWLSL